jgi:hypothetical protein
MGEFILGTKNYDTDWYLKYGLSYAEAAKTLREWGFSFILTQSRFLPMADSAVTSEVTQEMEARYASYDDLLFREALAKEGVSYWPTLCTFFNPSALIADPTLQPVDADGNLMPTIDWYVGITPSRRDYVDQQVEAIQNVVEILDPEGVFLSFIRWPGFWELWMPDHSRKDFPEYSYDRYSLQRFTQETGLRLPADKPSEVAAWIELNARQAWTRWKLQVITDVVRLIRDAVQAIKPSCQIMINTLPFGEADYDNAREKTFGQHLESLSDVVDIFEVMTYHQILKRPVEWIPTIGREVQRRTGKRTVCTLQVEPLYLEGMHAVEQRSPAIDVEDFSRAVKVVRKANLDGVVVFVWSDLLHKAFIDADTRWIKALQTVS